MLQFLAIAVLTQTQFAPGIYTVPDLCKLLTEKTGVEHRFDADYIDYPLYLSVKDGKLQRVEQLTALALRAKWEPVNKGVKLIHVPEDGGADFEEFKRQVDLAFAKHPFKGLPAQDLYQLRPGWMIRYGTPTTSLIRELPSELKSDQPAELKVRRFCFGMFELSSNGLPKNVETFSEGSQVLFESLPDAVEKLLGEDLKKPAAPPEDFEKMRRAENTPGGFQAGSAQDPVAQMLSLALDKIGGEVSHDLAIALPDMSIMSMVGDKPPQNIGEIFKKFASFDIWTTKDNAAVAMLPQTEFDYPCQTRRAVLKQLVDHAQSFGVATFQDISNYVRDQRPGASETWVDAMLLATSKVALDDSYIGDYPFNVRFGDALADSDWRLLKTRKQFMLSEMSQPAQEQVMNILLQSRARMGNHDEGKDPATWVSIKPGDLTMNPQLLEEPVLVAWTSAIAEIVTPDSAGREYSMRRKHLDHEPLYQPAFRKRLKVTICSPKSEEIETGFSEITLVPGSKPVIYKQLPKEAEKGFLKGLAEDQASRAQQTQPVNPP